MKKISTILAATDVWPASEQAERVAARLAAAFGAGLTLYHVFEPLAGWPVALLHQEQEQMTQVLRRRAARLRGESNGAFPCAVAVGVGPVADTVLRKAEEMGAGLVLIGAGEPSPLETFRVGPVAEAVLTHSPVPVLAVRPREPELSFRKVLCAVDMSPVSATAVRQAAGLARAFGAGLVLLSVVPKAGWLSAVTETGKLVGAAADYERHWREEFDQFVEGLDLAGVSWEKEVRHGEPHENIVAAVREDGADLLVMGSTGRSGLGRVLLGSTTRRVLRQLPCSLLAVNREAAEDEHAGHTGWLMAEGRRMLSAGCYHSALLKFREVLAYSPFHAPAWEGQAQALGKLGRLRKRGAVWSTSG